MTTADNDDEDEDDDDDHNDDDDGGDDDVDVDARHSVGDANAEVVRSVFTAGSTEHIQQFEMDRDRGELQMRQYAAVIETVAFSV
ncbi:hypothetical protein SprV_0602095500 [Sparganum proliferum]